MKTLREMIDLIESAQQPHQSNTKNPVDFPKTWHDVDKKLGRAVDKMSQAEKVKKGLAHPDTLKKQGVEEGYYDLNDDGMQPIDLSANPSFKQIINRYTQLVYQGHAGETSPEEEQEYNDIEQYVAKRFGAKGSAHLQKAGEVSYWGRDDGRGMGSVRSSNLGRPNQPSGDFRTTKAGKMHGQDAKMMKAKVADRLGRHPAPKLPEGVEEEQLEETTPEALSKIDNLFRK